MRRRRRTRLRRLRRTPSRNPSASVRSSGVKAPASGSPRARRTRGRSRDRRPGCRSGRPRSRAPSCPPGRRACSSASSRRRRSSGDRGAAPRGAGRSRRQLRQPLDHGLVERAQPQLLERLEVVERRRSGVSVGRAACQAPSVAPAQRPASACTRPSPTSACQLRAVGRQQLHHEDVGRGVAVDDRGTTPGVIGRTGASPRPRSRRARASRASRRARGAGAAPA